MIHIYIYEHINVHPHFYGQMRQGWIFTLGQIIPNKYAETNMSAKFYAFIRDVNIWLIFDHNFDRNHKLIRLASRICGTRGEIREALIFLNQAEKYRRK